MSNIGSEPMGSAAGWGWALASFPGLHAQLLLLAVRKSGGKAWKDLSRDECHCWCHVLSAHIWVCSLPFTLLSLNSVRSFCSICPASLIATGSIVASYSTWHQQWHAPRDKSFQAFPPLFVLQATKTGRGGLGTRLGEHNCVCCSYCHL